ncbi:hypothetical protein H0H92_013277 [Tricholoma furcatifolium]|nr:hypothetical protein H0H92_013277 [Tricholoma furcatifolium]
MPSSFLAETDSIFARAYASAIKTTFQIDLADHFELMTSPVTQRGIPAGDLIRPEITNYLIYKFADALQYSDNISYTGGSAGSYIQQLRSWTDWVKTNIDASDVTISRLDNAQVAAISANDNYWTTLSEALSKYNQVKELFPNQTFWEWAGDNYPLLSSINTVRQNTQSELYAAIALRFGPDAVPLAMYMDNISAAQSSNAYPGYNQSAIVNEDEIANSIEYANHGKMFPSPKGGASDSDDVIRVPEYSIPDYRNAVQGWITAARNGAARDQTITIDMKQGNKTTWGDYGFSDTNISGGEGDAGFWPFFHADVRGADGKWDSMTLDTKNHENEVSLTLAMIGMGKFDTRPGQWNIPSIQTLFPNRLPGAPDVLNPTLSRVVNVLVGYDVQLQVTFGSSLRGKVDQIYQEVKSNGGNMSVFGFHVSTGEPLGAGGGTGNTTKHVVTKFNDVQWDKENGQMILTPTAGQAYPTILGVVAERFDPPTTS